MEDLDELGLVGNWMKQIYSGETLFDGSNIVQTWENCHSDIYGKRAITLKAKLLDKYEDAFYWVLETYNFVNEGFQSGRDNSINRLDFYLNGYGSYTDNRHYIDFVLHESKGKFPKAAIEKVITNKDEVKRLQRGMKWILLAQKNGIEGDY